MKLSNVVAAAAAGNTTSSGNPLQINRNILNRNSATEPLTLNMACGNNMKCEMNGVAKKVARFNRFSKLRKTLISKTHEETRLTKKYASSNFSIGTACSANNVKKLKCLLVGDPCVGKSTLMCWFLKRIFQTEYQPTIVDDFEGTHKVLNFYDFWQF